MRAALSAGYDVIFSSCWYVSNIHYGQDWRDLYKCDPASVKGECRLTTVIFTCYCHHHHRPEPFHTQKTGCSRSLALLCIYTLMMSPARLLLVNLLMLSVHLHLSHPLTPFPSNVIFMILLCHFIFPSTFQLHLYLTSFKYTSFFFISTFLTSQFSC